MKTASLNRILVYTLVAITVIATYITVNSYYTQVSIYEEKELFKLDCIANAVAYKISGEEFSELINRYPGPDFQEAARGDSTYQEIFTMMSMAKKMTGVPSEMSTVVKDVNGKSYLLVVGTDRDAWLEELAPGYEMPDSLYMKGGMLGRYDLSGETRLGAVSPVKNETGETVGVLRVEETFDSFLQKARNQIYVNLLISLLFVVIIGVLMFFSIRAILIRQRKLAQEKAELESLRQELVANVSHDLRTPLASIHGYLETVLMKMDELDDQTRKKYLNTTLQSTDRLRLLVDELFELSRLESKERKLNEEEFVLPELVFDVVNHIKGSALQRNIRIETDIPANLPRVKGDVQLIDRVLQNILGNAVKYSDDGSVVWVRISRDQGNLRVEVADQGQGIAEEDIPHVFDRFRRGKTSRQGSGLGLAIVRSILDLHGSKYGVTSRTGEGTTFFFTVRTIAS